LTGIGVSSVAVLIAFGDELSVMTTRIERGVCLHRSPQGISDACTIRAARASASSSLKSRSGKEGMTRSFFPS
jgi:hypothetical protein